MFETSNFLQFIMNYYDFIYVTLASKDNQNMKCHRIIISASSPYFNYLLKKNKHHHPLIYMKGMKKLFQYLHIISWYYFPHNVQ